MLTILALAVEVARNAALPGLENAPPPPRTAEGSWVVEAGLVTLHRGQHLNGKHQHQSPCGEPHHRAAHQGFGCPRRDPTLIEVAAAQSQPSKGGEAREGEDE